MILMKALESSDVENIKMADPFPLSINYNRNVCLIFINGIAEEWSRVRKKYFRKLI